MGAFPDGLGRPRSAGFSAMTTAPPPAAPPPSTAAAARTRRPGSPRPRRPGRPARPQLRRSRTDKILGGVSGGLAEYSGIDALLWRVGFVALALAGGTGVIVYLLLWLLMPAGPTAYGPPAYGAPGSQRVKAPAGPRSPVPGRDHRRAAHRRRRARPDHPVQRLGPRAPRLPRHRPARRRARAGGRGLHRRPDGARWSDRARRRPVARARRRLDPAVERRARRGRRPHLPAGDRRPGARRLPRRRRRHDRRPDPGRRQRPRRPDHHPDRARPRGRRRSGSPATPTSGSPS